MRGPETGFCHLNYISGPAAMSLVQCQKCALVMLLQLLHHTR